jgi:hypothetical protein
MAKIKYLVTGMNNQELGGLVGTLVGGELTGEAELLCCLGSPKAYKVGASGQVTELPFETLLSDLVRKERVKRGMANLKVLPDKA